MSETLAELGGEGMAAAGWTLEREISTLVKLARSGDRGVALRALAELRRVRSECVRHRLDSEVRSTGAGRAGS